MTQQKKKFYIRIFDYSEAFFVLVIPFSVIIFTSGFLNSITPWASERVKGMTFSGDRADQLARSNMLNQGSAQHHAANQSMYNREIFYEMVQNSPDVALQELLLFDDI